jgi:glycosyltransferase involved in cell wall biosynthesis
LRRAVEAAGQSSPAVNTRVIGFRNQRELSPYYHAADMLALPSRHSETWGLVVNEALMHGVPAVVSDRVGCAPDLVLDGRTGSVCQSDSAASLGEALLATDGLGRTDDGRAACRDQVERYSVARAAAGIVEAYAGALRATGKAA